MDEKRDKESNHTEMLECEKSEKKTPPQREIIRKTFK